MNAPKPQLLTDCADLESLITSDEWVMEEKLDGDRLIVVKTGNDVQCFTRHGNRVTCDMVTAVALTSDSDFTLDGELMPGGEFVAFDILSQGGMTAKAMTYEWRSLFLPLFAFRTPRCASNETTKRELLDTIKTEGGEGVVFKRTKAPYQFNARTDDWQRYKFYESDDFIVGQVNIAKCSFEVLRGGVSYGFVACGMNRLPSTGETVRIRYDKITEKGKLLRAKLAR